MRRALLGLLTAALVLLTGCSGGSDDKPDGPISSDQIDRDAWRAELVAAGGVRADPDLDKLEEITRGDCEKDVDDLAIMLSLSGSRPDLVRISMKYVCPEQAHKVDDALEQLQDAVNEVDEACSTAPELRTEDQQQMAEAMGCD